LKACQQGMVEVGARYEKKEYFIGELMMSAEIFRGVSEILKPHMKGAGLATSGKIVIGTVKGDLHNIGKDIVVSMLRTANYEVIDLGIDVPPARFVEALKESGASVVGLSGLLTLAFKSMKDTVDAISQAGIRNQVNVMIGGGPVDANVCANVGADGWGDAQRAVKLAQQWVHSS
jgi:methanogenic corrinoid protein MtbC1